MLGNLNPDPELASFVVGPVSQQFSPVGNQSRFTLTLHNQGPSAVWAATASTAGPNVGGVQIIQVGGQITFQGSAPITSVALCGDRGFAVITYDIS